MNRHDSRELIIHSGRLVAFKLFCTNDDCRFMPTTGNGHRYTGVPVTITRRGHKSAVIISAEEFERYQAARMDDEFAAIMAVHGDEIRELADK